MRLTKEREAEIRRRKLQREGESKTYLDPDIQLLFAEIDYLRDSFLDMAVVMNALTEERDQLKSKLDIAIEAISIQVLAKGACQEPWMTTPQGTPLVHVVAFYLTKRKRSTNPA